MEDRKDYEIHIVESFDVGTRRRQPLQKIEITSSQFEAIQFFADIEKDEDLNITYIINKCRFKVIPTFIPSSYRK